MAKKAAWLPTFLCNKNKKEKQRKKRKSFKAETIKRLSPRSKCYYFSNVNGFILERLEFKHFSVFYDPSTLISILLVLPNLALIFAALHQKLTNLRCVLGGMFYYFLWISFLSFLFFHLFEICKCWYRKKQLWLRFINSIFWNKFLRFNIH